MAGRNRYTARLGVCGDEGSQEEARARFREQPNALAHHQPPCTLTVAHDGQHAACQADNDGVDRRSGGFGGVQACRCTQFERKRKRHAEAKQMACAGD